MAAPLLHLNASLTHWEFAMYVIGWLVWTPSYVVALVDFYRHREDKDRPCLIPTIAVCGNVAFEGIWFLLGDFSHAGLVKWLYFGAFLLDIPILIGVLIYGSFGAPRRFDANGDLYFGRSRRDRDQHYAVVVFVFLLWVAAYIALRSSFEVPLGSVGAYLDNVVMSGLFVWTIWLDPTMPASKWMAWSKGLGTFFVTIFVGLRYNGASYAFLYLLAAVSAILDVWYIWLAHHPRQLPANIKPLHFEGYAV